MKRLIFAMLLFLLPLSSPLGAERTEMKVHSKVVSVTVYPQNAFVTRAADIKLTPGSYKLVLSGLPIDLVDESVRAEGEGVAKVDIGEIGVRKVFLEKAHQEEISKLEGEIQKLEDTERGLKDSIDVLKSRIKLLDSIRVLSPEVLSKDLTAAKIDPSAWQKAIDFTFRNLDEAKAGIRRLEAERRELTKRLEVLRKKLDQIRTGRPDTVKERWADVEVRSGGSYSFRASYVVRNASWRPHYRARAFPDEGRMELLYLGKVSQLTGEDWEDVEVTLSTAKPAFGAQAPELPPWYLDFYPRPKEVGVPMRKRAVLMEAARPAAGVAPPSEAIPTGVSVLFKISGVKDIPSTKEGSDILIGSWELSPDYSYITVPKASSYAYLRAKVKNETAYPFLSGSVGVFVGHDYLGKSSIKNIAPSEEFELSLGIDEGIKVKRELVKKYREKTGVVSKKEKVSYIYRIEVESYKKRRCSVTVVDQLPVSQTEEIKVEEIKLKPKPDERDEKGILKWNITLDPGKKAEIEIGFSVEYPRGSRVMGLF